MLERTDYLLLFSSSYLSHRQSRRTQKSLALRLRADSTEAEPMAMRATNSKRA